MKLFVIEEKNKLSLYELVSKICTKSIAKSNLNIICLDNILENFTEELSSAVTMNFKTKIQTHEV